MKTKVYVCEFGYIIKEGLKGFSSKSKLSRMVFGMRSIRKYYKISGQSYYEPPSWFMIATCF